MVATLPAVAAAALAGAAHDSLDACRAALRVAGAGLDRCEVAENTLTRRLAGVDRDTLPAGLAAELADVEQSVLIARRVHNDAVRDTLDLRSRRLVRWLRLAGTAPAPAYFEIAEPPPWRPSPSGATTSARGRERRAGTGSAGPPDVPSVGRTGGNRRPGRAVGPRNRSDGARAGRPESPTPRAERETPCRSTRSRPPPPSWAPPA